MPYTAVLLNEESRNRLLESATVIAKEGMEIKCHHMTVDLKPISKSMAAHMAGRQVELKVVRFGMLTIDGKAIMAAEVECEVPSKNTRKHVTIAHHPEIKPKMSNEIQEWVEVTPFTLYGTVQEVA